MSKTCIKCDQVVVMPELNNLCEDCKREIKYNPPRYRKPDKKYKSKGYKFRNTDE